MEQFLQDTDVDSISSSCAASSNDANQDTKGEGVAKQGVLGGRRSSGHEVTDSKRDQGDHRVTD